MVNARFVISIIGLVIIINLIQAGLVHLVAHISKRLKTKRSAKSTNYSRIKNMSMEQVAGLLWDMPFMWETYEDVLKWLNSEVNDD